MPFFLQSPIWMQSIWKKLTRAVVMAGCFWMSPERKKEMERWLRGREQWKKLRQADCVVVSFGKSGRTWLRVMISRFFQVRDGLPEHLLIGFDNFHRRRPAVPKIFFTHDNYLEDYTGHRDSRSDYRGRKVVLLVRHPGDVAVSQYFQWRFRMKPHKKAINDYPEHGEEVGVFDFMHANGGGLPKILRFMDLWAREIAQNDDVLIVRYEDLRSQPEAELARLLEFIGTPGSEEQVAEAVRFASFDNMRKLEEKRTFWLSGGRMKPKDRNNPDSFKVRRGKVGGFRDYLEDSEIERIEKQLEAALDPVWRYTPAEPSGQSGESGKEGTA
ncbi:MAG: sulfotransferase domain-containing protein [Myxococcota bacterium]